MAKKKVTNDAILSSESLDELSFIGLKHDCESYRLVYYLNNTFKLNLSRESGFNYYKEDEQKSYPFPLYMYVDKEYRLHYFLIQTKYNNVLIDGSVDYYNSILLILGSEHIAFAKRIIDRYSEMPGVFLCESMEFDETDIPKNNKLKKFKKNLSVFLKDALLLDIQQFLSESLRAQNDKEKQKEEDVFFQF